MGCGVKDIAAYAAAVSSAATVFQEATTLGFKFSVLDIGGGFPSGLPAFRKVILVLILGKRCFHTFMKVGRPLGNCSIEKSGYGQLAVSLWRDKAFPYSLLSDSWPWPSLTISWSE